MHYYEWNGNNSLLDTSGNLWFNSYVGILVKFDGTNYTVYDTTNSNIGNYEIGEIALDSASNDIWITRKANILTKFHNGNFTNYVIPPIYVINYAPRLSVDNSGNVWIYANFLGAIKFDGATFQLVSNIAFTNVGTGLGSVWLQDIDTIFKYDNNQIKPFYIFSPISIAYSSGYRGLQVYDNSIHDKKTDHIYYKRTFIPVLRFPLL